VAPPAKPAAPEPAIGAPFRDGKFEFTVTSLKHAASAGNDTFGKKAQGVFVLVNVKVKNTGDEAQTFDSSPQKLHDAAGRQYDADGAAAMYLGGDAKSFLEQINPGNAVTGVVIFDVPKGTKLNELELHDSIFSGGVTVPLGGVAA
jgi:hypothetical protein